MFIVLQNVIHPVTREPLLAVGQLIRYMELVALSKEFGFDMPKHLHQTGVIQVVS
jgi:hypothetical protein